MGQVFAKHREVPTPLCDSPFRKWDSSAITAVIAQVSPLHLEGIFQIDRASFDTCFNVSGVDAQHLWEAFHQDSDEQRSTLVVLCGLIFLCKLSLRDKAIVLFHLFDFSNTAHLTADDVAVLLLSLTRAMSLMSFEELYDDVPIHELQAAAATWVGHTGKLAQDNFVDRTLLVASSLPALVTEPVTHRVDSSTAAEPESRFAVGHRVLTRQGTAHIWYPAQVAAVNADGTYDIRHGAGVVVKGVVKDAVKDMKHSHSADSIGHHTTSSPPAAASATVLHVSLPPPEGEVVANGDDSATGGSEAKDVVSYVKGDKVMALFGGRKWYAATITAVRANGTYDVEYHDGDEDEGLTVEELKPRLKWG